jgi:hypothetical protein
MKASELVGKVAIRTAPCVYPNGAKDGSYQDSPLLIVGVTDAHILTQHVGKERKIFGDEIHILRSDWLDDNWTDYNALIQKAQPILSRFAMQEVASRLK